MAVGWSATKQAAVSLPPDVTCARVAGTIGGLMRAPQRAALTLRSSGSAAAPAVSRQALPFCSAA